MNIKPLSHAIKLYQHKKGDAFAVCGYPRSGTTMISELVSIVTPYFFDRNNIFPVTGSPILHSHWNPKTFRNNSTIYIVRNPRDVARSVYFYCAARRMERPEKNFLEQHHVCKINWKTHVSLAQDAGLTIIKYDRLRDCEKGTVRDIAKVLDVPADWIDCAVWLLRQRHERQPAYIDAVFEKEKKALSQHERKILEDKITNDVQEEAELYEKL